MTLKLPFCSQLINFPKKIFGERLMSMHITCIQLMLHVKEFVLSLKEKTKYIS